MMGLVRLTGHGSRDGRGQLIHRGGCESNIARPTVGNKRAAARLADDGERRSFGMRAAFGAARDVNVKIRAESRCRDFGYAWRYGAGRYMRRCADRRARASEHIAAWIV